MKKATFRHEPALWLGLGLAILQAVLEAVNGNVTWDVTVPLITGLLIRFFVYSPATVDQIKNG